MFPSRSRCAPRRLGALALLSAVTAFAVGCGGGHPGAPNAQVAPGGVAEARKAMEKANTENYDLIVDNPFISARAEPRSTFSASVDTASYSNLRRFLNQGQLPPKDAVRIADMVNYFDYEYPRPRGNDPVAIHLELGSCPWQPKHHLLRIALAARKIDPSELPPRNLVFLIDTSGSMAEPNKLPLVQQSLRLLAEQLSDKDRVAIVTYAGNSRVALTTTSGEQKRQIENVIDSLQSGGSTAGAGGIVAAYEQAKRGYIDGGVNRVILATDGDFNVGISSDAELVRLIEEKRQSGIYLTVLGYGMGNLKDSKLEQLAHHGNGHYAYIDSIDEAKKVFADQGGALVTVAKDVKLQVEFNPKQVNAYRLIGYENRVLRTEDFRDDKKDAGDMGSGHTCTALYEIVPAGVTIDLPEVEPLKYQTPPGDAAAAGEGWMTVRMRYKHPQTDVAGELAIELPASGLRANPSGDFRFAASVAAFGMLLRDSQHKGASSLGMVRELAESARGPDPNGYREEFVTLVRKAEALKR